MIVTGGADRQNTMQPGVCAVRASHDRAHHAPTYGYAQ